jgi:hypothetical protein
MITRSGALERKIQYQPQLALRTVEGAVGSIGGEETEDAPFPDNVCALVSFVSGSRIVSSSQHRSTTETKKRGNRYSVTAKVIIPSNILSPNRGINNQVHFTTRATQLA